MGPANDLIARFLDAQGFSVPPDDLQDVVTAVQSLSSALAHQVGDLPDMAITDSFESCLRAHSMAPALTASAVSVPKKSELEGASYADRVQQQLNRIHDHPLSKLAWLELFEEQAVAAAHNLNPARVSGPLHGVSVGLKDMFDIAGRVATYGTQNRQHLKPPQQDAAIVRNLRSAGALVLGTLHMAEYAMSPTGLNAHLGPGRNPLNTDYASGGSSSGSGMVVGAGMVDVAIGSDTGGSVRLPSGFCGITGLKPTQYRVPLQGAMPLAPSLDCIGPLARDAQYCADAYAALVAGADESIRFAANGRVDLERHIDTFTVAVPQFDAGELISERMVSALKSTVSALESVGVHILRVPMPNFDLFGKLGSIILGAESAALHRRTLAQCPESYGKQVRRRLSRGLLISSIDYYDAVRIRGAMLDDFMRNSMQGAHAMLLPLAPDTPPRLQDTIGAPEHILERRYSSLSYWTRGINYLGLPGVAFPVEIVPEGVPLAVQLVGAPYTEMCLLAQIHRLQQKELVPTLEN